MADGLKRIKLSEDYAGQKAGSIYVCDPLRAEWLLENDHGREATKADLDPKPKRVKAEDEPEDDDLSDRLAAQSAAEAFADEPAPKPRRRKGRAK